MFKKYLIFSLVIAFVLSFAVIPIYTHADLTSDALTGGVTGASLGSTSGSTSSSSSSSSSCKKPSDIGELFTYALCLLGSGVVPFLIGLGLVLFLIGVVNYVRAGDNEEKRQAGRDLMIFGIVALFVMVGVWGLVKILYNTFFDTSFSVNSGSPIQFVK